MSGERHTHLTCYCCPLPPWPADQQRWARFCLTIRLRIHQVRERDGISSRRGDEWKTFVPALPAHEARPSPARVGRLVPLPTTPRDSRGRWQRQERAS